jgi:hypothetical protein
MPNPPEGFISPFEATERLYVLAAELEKHGVPLEQLDCLAAISRRFHHHFKSLAEFSERLHILAEEFSW